MKIAISGGTGFVGKRLVEKLKRLGATVFVLTRGTEKTVDGVQYITWMNGKHTIPELEGIDAFINLAGVSLNEGRWTVARKNDIFKSRMDTTNEVLRIFDSLSARPKVYINASAIGIYPTSTTAIYTEQSVEVANDFLGRTVSDWEQKALQAEQLGIRTCLARFGVILGRDSGALPLIALPYKLFVGGTVGSGEQWLSWIHVDDVCEAILHLVNTPELYGPINFTSPNAKRMKQFGKIVGNALHRPHWLPVPSLALKLALGEKSQLVLEGQYVVPEKLLSSGFQFKFSSLEDAIIDLYKG
ncbi:TIGR01777 family oxidoreductase [Lysinibacillus sp. 54212]|uniref:TIGR01777 family oxidoreductase n=1 Tax=Lysinibacillus sp. 54212 TaxID=3119829 RepID=UPI002FCADCD3